ncbi:MAG: MoxR family ATPase [Nannocystaceae bacterium]
MTAPKRFIDVDDKKGTSVWLEPIGGLPRVRHRYEKESLHAINAAVASRRPLLVRGEPGTGKSQLARAAAKLLGREFVWKVMDAQARVSDLFYAFDAVERLAQAQVAGAAYPGNPNAVKAALGERKFIEPGPLWWAFDAARAKAWPKELEESAEPREVTPYVVLIDEIDKTDPSVPNGLLEALGQGTFSVRRVTTVSQQPKRQPPPLVVITTNNERELPSAFVRRCMVLHIELPPAGPELVDWLVERGQTHFEALSAEVLTRAAKLVSRDHEIARGLGVTPPGQAEYLDLLRALAELADDETSRRELLEQIADFALKKHPDQRRVPGASDQ